MESIKPIRLRLSEKLKNLDYFNKFFDERTRDEVASQLRELREMRGLSQVKFAAEADMKQSAVSRIEQSDYSGWTYKTLLRAANVLRARLKIEFIPAERVIEDYKNREAEQRTSELVHTLTATAFVDEMGSSADKLESGPDASGNLDYRNLGGQIHVQAAVAAE